MQFSYGLTFLTLVLGLFISTPSFSAPTENVDLDSSKPSEKTSPQNSQVLEEKNLVISEPVATPSDKKAIRNEVYPYKQSMSPRLGFALDPDLLSNAEFPVLFGFSYMFERRRSPQPEISVDILTDSRAHISGMLRRIFYERESYRPYVRAGLCVQAHSDENLATFSEYENYFFRAGLGTEITLNLPMSARLEAETLINGDSQMVILTVGYSWGW